MANFAQTVSNTLNVLGASPPNYWGVMDWGDNWGVSEDLATSFEKWLQSESMSLSDAWSKNYSILKVNSISLSHFLDICKRYEIYCKVWTGPTSNGAEAVYDEFTKIGN